MLKSYFPDATSQPTQTSCMWFSQRSRGQRGRSCLIKTIDGMALMVAIAYVPDDGLLSNVTVGCF